MATQGHQWIRLAAGASAFAALACSAHAQTCSVLDIQPGGGEVSLSGATLFVPFFQTPVSSHDWLDADGDGCSTTICKGFPGQPADQLATPWSPGFTGSTFFELQYRSVGSVNGYREFIANQLCGLFSNTVPPEQGLLNTFAWATGGVKNPLTAPGCDFLAADADGDTWAFPGADGTAENDPGTPTSIDGIDIAVLDVPSVWATIVPGTGVWDAKPATAGFGNNPIPAANDPAYFSLLPSLCRNCPSPGESLIEDCDPKTDPGCECLNTDINDPDGNTIYDNQITWVPIVYIANRGVGNQSSYKITELQHLMVTGRLPNGENLAGATRSVGSGTRNGMMNTSGIDPAWGMGDNIDAEWATTSAAYLGPGRRISNAQGSSQIEEAVKYSRLAIGYTGLAGAGRAAADAQAGQYEIVRVVFDDAGGTVPVTPTIASALINCSPNSGFRLGGAATFVTRGSIDQNNPAAPDYMDNQVARLYVQNIYESVAAYDGTPAPPAAQQSPADYLVTNFTLLQGQSCTTTLADPIVQLPNPDLNPAIQSVSISTTTTVTPPFGVVTPANFVPRRRTAGSPYADETQLGLSLTVGSAVQYGYKSSSGAVTQFGLTLGTGTTLIDKKLSARNRVQGDFNRDQLRNADDIAAMMKAISNPIDFEQDVVPAGGWGGSLGDMPQDVVIAHVIGDFDGNGQFDAEDVRYFADGLALVPQSLAGGTGLVLDRQAGFTAVDEEWAKLPGGDSNYFNIEIHDAKGSPTGTYNAGDARADIAGNTPWAGAQPVGHDGVVDCDDVLYVAANLGNFQNVSEAAIVAGNKRLDLSADMNGNLVINCEDVAAILAIMGESDLSACGLIAGCQFADEDLDQDGDVDGFDLAMLLGQWTGAATYSPCPPVAAADFNADCRINGFDLAILLGAWTGS